MQASVKFYSLRDYFTYLPLVLKNVNWRASTSDELWTAFTLPSAYVTTRQIYSNRFAYKLLPEGEYMQSSQGDIKFESILDRKCGLLIMGYFIKQFSNFFPLPSRFIETK